MSLNMGTRSTTQRGSSILEFAMVAPLLALMIYGVFTTGMSISKSQQVAALARESGTMFLRLVDFSIPANQNMLIRQAAAIGGDGVIVLSAFKMIGDGDCRAGGLDPNNCPNVGYAVVVKRQVVGNRELFHSTFGSPEDNGSIPASRYLTEPDCRAEKLDTLVSLAAGENAYLSEVFFRTHDSTIYQRAIF